MFELFAELLNVSANCYDKSINITLSEICYFLQNDIHDDFSFDVDRPIDSQFRAESCNVETMV